MATNDENWLLIAITAFGGGIVSNIIIPARRGIFGFCSAGIIGIFCGFTAAYCSGFGLKGQVLLAAIVGIAADYTLTRLAKKLSESRETNINITGGTNINQFGEDNKGEQ